MKKDEFDRLMVGMAVMSTYTGMTTRHRVVAIDRTGERPVIQVTEWPLRSNRGWVDATLFTLLGEGEGSLTSDEKTIQRQ